MAGWVTGALVLRGYTFATTLEPGRLRLLFQHAVCVMEWELATEPTANPIVASRRAGLRAVDQEVTLQLAEENGAVVGQVWPSRVAVSPRGRIVRASTLRWRLARFAKRLQLSDAEAQITPLQDPPEELSLVVLEPPVSLVKLGISALGLCLLIAGVARVSSVEFQLKCAASRFGMPLNTLDTILCGLGS